MAKKRSDSPLVYSTDPSFRQEEENEEITTLPPSDQRLRVLLDNKQRAGKMVTLVTGFEGNMKDMEALGKSLKASCGTGGSVKDGEILIQGDNREKVMQWLLKNGYKNVKKL